MTRYESLTFAISILESIRRALGENGNDSAKTGEHIRNLQGIARDVRYGGKWEGDGDRIAEVLEICAGRGGGCGACPFEPYRASGCRSMLKEEAARAIRQLKEAEHEKH